MPGGGGKVEEGTVYSRSLQGPANSKVERQAQVCSIFRGRVKYPVRPPRGHLGRPGFQAGGPHGRRRGEAEFAPYSPQEEQLRESFLLEQEA